MNKKIQKIIDLIKINNKIEKFSLRMYEKMKDSYDRKGVSWNFSDKKFLQDKLREHLELKHYVDVANFCFMLDDLGETKGE
jgi:hypothetical protein